MASVDAVNLFSNCPFIQLLFYLAANQKLREEEEEDLDKVAKDVDLQEEDVRVHRLIIGSKRILNLSYYLSYYLSYLYHQRTADAFSPSFGIYYCKVKIMNELGT